MYAGRKFKIVSYIEDDKDAYYGARIGDVITLSDNPKHMAGDAVWAKRHGNKAFTASRWKDFEYLCLCNNANELQENFEEVV